MKRKASKDGKDMKKSFKQPRREFAYNAKGQGVVVGGMELKWNDISTVTTAASTTMVVTPLSNIAQGSTNLTRNGAKIEYKAVSLRCRFDRTFLTAGVAATPDQIRIMLVIDRQSNGAALAAAEILNATTMTSHSNITAFPRFHVLLDKVINLNLDMAADTVAKRFFIKKYIKIKPSEWSVASYNLTTASIPYSNSLSLIYFGTQGTYTTAVAIDARVKFIG